MAIQRATGIQKMRIGGVNLTINGWEGRCDKCGFVAPNKGKDPGDIHALLEKAGWKTISSGVSRPLRWHCAKCLDSKATNGKGTVHP